MPPPLLGELAYTAFCAALHLPVQWTQLSVTERLAWGHAVFVAVRAASDLSAYTPAEVPPDKPCREQAYELYTHQRRPVTEIAQLLGVAPRTVYRYVQQGRRQVA